MHYIFTAFLLMALSMNVSFAQVSPTQSQVKPSKIVMTWIPPYGIEESIQALDSNPLIGQTINRLGLQLWNPSSDGKSLVFAPTNVSGKLVTDADVKRLIKWAKQRNIEVLLTIYNNSQVIGKWDWDLAKRAFADNPDSFTKALLSEMHKYNLDGIDLDLEGEGQLNEDRAAYAKFVKNLSIELRKNHKLLTIDSFHSPCKNAPNMSWWPDWKGQIDAIHSMGYQDLYESSVSTFSHDGKSVCENGAHIFKYSWQLQYAIKAGYQAHQLFMGMPTWLKTWGRKGFKQAPASHIKEAQNLGLGIALWDAQLRAESWRSDSTWKAMRTYQQKHSSK